METAVVILNYNGINFLKQFLPDVLKFTANADIYVADNASTDDSVAYVHENFQQVKIIQNSSNLGFASGYNEALRDLNYKYFVLLNSDIELTENWLAPLVHLANSDSKIAAIQPKIRSFYQKDSFEYAGAAGGFLDFLGFAFCRGRIFDTIEKDEGQYNSIIEIFWASGACLFVRAEFFHKLQGFDDRFFAHMEEIDLCWRLKNRGFKIKYCPESVVYHVGGGTLHKSNPFKTFLNYRNNLAMLFKNLPSQFLFTTIFARLIIDGVSSIKFLKEGNFKDIWAIVKAHFAFYAMIPYLWKKREKQFLAYDQLYQKSIVWQYFVKGKKYFSEC